MYDLMIRAVCSALTMQMLLSLAFPVVFGRPLTLLLDQPPAFSGPIFYQVFSLFGARPVSDLTSVLAAKGCALMSRGEYLLETTRLLSFPPSFRVRSPMLF